jgi:hypothetical protein
MLNTSWLIAPVRGAETFYASSKITERDKGSDDFVAAC